MKNSIIAMVFSRGRVYTGQEGVMYDGAPPKHVNLTGCLTLESVRSKIHRRLKLNNNEIVTTVVYRFPQTDNHYVAFELTDDEDVSCAMAAFNDHNYNSMELYIDIEEVENVAELPNHFANICDDAGPSTRGNLGESEGSTGRRRIRSAASRVRCDDGGYDAVAVNIRSQYDAVLNSSVAGISPVRTANLADEGCVGNVECTDDEPLNVQDAFDTAIEEEGDSPNDDDSDDGMDRTTENHEFYGPNPVMCASAGRFSERSYSVSDNPIPLDPIASFIDWDVFHCGSEFPGIIYGNEASDSDELFKGKQFESKSALIYALKVYHVRRHARYNVLESCKNKLAVRCEYYGVQCDFALRAINVKDQGTWKITKFSSPHSCVNPSITQDHKLLDSDFICSCIVGMLKVQQNVPVALIQERIESMFGYKVSYKKAWKAKQKAIVIVYGDWDQSYNLLPKFMDLLEYTDQAIYKLECDPCVTKNHRVDRSRRVFHRLFWAFKPCIASFPYCKKFIQVDATHLYGKHKGSLLIAATQDGNRCPVPLAFAIVEKENLDNWSWFLGLIRTHVTQARGVCLISDRHPAIIQAVANENLGWQPPHGHHCFCIRHIGSNVHSDCKDVHVKNFVIKIAYEPRRSKVQAKLEQLRTMHEETHRRMMDVPLHQWCLAYDEGRRYGHMTTNIVECINGIFKGIRRLPITGLVQHTFYRCVKYWVDRANEAVNDMAAGNIYTSNFRKEIETIQSRASSYQVRAFNRSWTRFQVIEGHDPSTGEDGRIMQVFLDERECECGRFKAMHYPCSHVIAACASRKISWDPFVDDVYKLQTLRNCYDHEWWPICDLSEWHNADGGPTIIPNPARLRDKGRPKSTRIKNAMDWPQEPGPRQKCSKCKQEGHNRRNCRVTGTDPSPSNN